MVLVEIGGAGELEITGKTGLEDVDSPGVGEAVAANEAMGEVEEGSRSTAVEKELVKPTVVVVRGVLVEVVVEGATIACSETVTEI